MTIYSGKVYEIDELRHYEVFWRFRSFEDALDRLIAVARSPWNAKHELYCGVETCWLNFWITEYDHGEEVRTFPILEVTANGAQWLPDMKESEPQSE